MSDARNKASWLPRTATAFAVLSCYGTTALIALLSLLGVSLVINERAWPSAISVLSALATLAIAVSYRRHRIIGPIVVAVLGLGLILWTMHASYSRAIELVGFVLLVAAALWDWRAGTNRGAAADDVPWMEVSDLADQLNRGSATVIVDVRGSDEFHGELGHLRGARNIPLAELQGQLSELIRFKELELTLVCRTQMRSAKAATLLRNAGFRDVRVLRGGMDQWNANGLPVEQRSTRLQP